jgi:hypothetical protein
MYIYTNSKFMREWLNTNPITWYKNNILFKNFIFKVNESDNNGSTLKEEPLVLNEDEDWHD